MEEEKDENGQLDLNKASAAAVVGAGFHMQDKAKEAMTRINQRLDDAEDIAIQTKEELQKQNERLMVIDESLNRIDKTTVRLKKMGQRLKKSLQANKLHCFCTVCICLNIVIFIVLLFTSLGGDKKIQDEIKIWE